MNQMAEKQEEGANIAAEMHQYLSFRIEDNHYAVDIMQVREIRGWQETTRIPNAPNFMRGVINLRGIVIPIFDLRARFGQHFTDATEKHVVIVLWVGQRTIGMLVDAVSDILNVTSEDIKPAPERHDSGLSGDYISGLIALKQMMVVLLDVNHLFDQSSLKTAASLAEASSSGRALESDRTNTNSNESHGEETSENDVLTQDEGAEATA